MIDKIRRYLKRYSYKGTHASDQTANRSGHQAQHRWTGGSQYHKPGATHWGNWYDEKTGLYPTIPAVNEWTWI